MCLNSITQDADPHEQGEGYKVFRKSPNGELQSLYAVTSSPGKLFQYQPNAWIADPSDYLLEADNERANGYHGNEYKTGFHLFADEKDAKDKADSRNQQDPHHNHYVVRKVKFRNVTAKGTQSLHSWFDGCLINHAPAIVAREIFIEEPKEE